MDYNQLGIEAMQEGDYEKAAEAFTKAIEENKEDAIPYINFANLLSSVNELERALAFYDKALELDSSAHCLLWSRKCLCCKRNVQRSQRHV